MSDEVRTGDRYIRGTDKITINRVTDDGEIGYAVLSEDGKIWHSRTTLPLFPTWKKAGSGSGPYCVNHPLRDREIGTLYCPECVDQNAGNWAGLEPDDAKRAFAALQREDQGHD